MAYPAQVDDRFDYPMAYEATLSFQTRTRVEAAAPGYERRRADWPGTGRRLWTATLTGASGYAGASVGTAKALWDFFVARRGRAQAFVARDPEDLLWKRVRFTSDRLQLRRVGWEEYSGDCGFVEIWPGGTVVPTESNPESNFVPAPLPVTDIPGRGPEERVLETFPPELSLGAELWIEFQTVVVTASDGKDSRVSSWGANWRAGATVSYTTLEQAEAVAALDFFYARQGSLSAFNFTLPGIFSGAMRFVGDAAEVPRPGPETLGLRLEMVSIPAYGEF